MLEGTPPLKRYGILEGTPPLKLYGILEDPPPLKCYEILYQACKVWGPHQEIVSSLFDKQEELSEIMCS